MNKLAASIFVLSLASGASAAASAQTAPAAQQTPPATPQTPPAATGTSGNAADTAVATPTPGTGTTSAPATDAVPPDYRLGAGDKIRVEIYKEPQLSQSLQVRPDGKITMPLIGDLAAAGVTPIALRDLITARMRDYVVNPVVTVMVVETVASTVYVMGEVNKPGTLPLTGPMSVLQALAMAGGFRDFANTKDIRILRNGPGGVETLHFNYKDALKGDGQIVYLQRGDTVIVR